MEKAVINLLTFMDGDKFLEKGSNLIWEVKKVSRSSSGTLENPDFIVGFKVEGNLDERFKLKNKEDGLFWFNVEEIRGYIGKTLNLIEKGCESGRKDVKVQCRTIDEAQEECFFEDMGYSLRESFDLMCKDLVHKICEGEKFFFQYERDVSFGYEGEFEQWLKGDGYKTKVLAHIQFERECDYLTSGKETCGMIKELGYKFLITFVTLDNEDITYFSVFERYPELNKIDGLTEVDNGVLLYDGKLNKDDLVLMFINMDFGFYKYAYPNI